MVKDLSQSSERILLKFVGRCVGVYKKEKIIL